MQAPRCLNCGTQRVDKQHDKFYNLISGIDFRKTHLSSQRRSHESENDPAGTDRG
jgi:hypothetical protein